MPAGFIVLLLSACLCIVSCGLAEEGSASDLQEARVVLVFAAGEPGAPVETITLASTAGQPPTIEISRKAGSQLQSDKQAISPADFQGVWKIVLSKDLKTWVPQEGGDETDFGQQRLRITWRPAGAAEPQVHEVAWIRPLKNAAPYDELVKAIAPIARQHLKQIPSIYLR